MYELQQVHDCCKCSIYCFIDLHNDIWIEFCRICYDTDEWELICKYSKRFVKAGVKLRKTTFDTLMEFAAKRGFCKFSMHFYFVLPERSICLHLFVYVRLAYFRVAVVVQPRNFPSSLGVYFIFISQSLSFTNWDIIVCRGICL